MAKPDPQTVNKMALIRELRDKNVSGAALRHIRKGCGISQNQFISECQRYQAANGGRMVSKPESVCKLEANKRPRQVYAVIMETLVGKERYEKWLLIIHNERPHLLLEATTRGRR